MKASREYVESGQYRYRITNTGYSSVRYGVCEVCKKPASEIHYQVEQRRYSEGWTHYQCNAHWGHRECLETQRRA